MNYDVWLLRAIDGRMYARCVAECVSLSDAEDYHNANAEMLVPWPANEPVPTWWCVMSPPTDVSDYGRNVYLYKMN